MSEIFFVPMHVVLVHPEIAPNTGNIIRLCANTGVHLHLVEPLGFSLDDKLLRRGGLDYHELVDVTVHPDLASMLAELSGKRIFTFASRDARRYDEVGFADEDVLMFGAERQGLSDEVLTQFDSEHRLTIPMQPNNRSLNLANAVSIVVYEAWRQRGFPGSVPIDGALTSETPGAQPFDF